MKSIFPLALIFFLITMVSCHKPSMVKNDFTNSIIILNEGTFGFGTSEISTYQRESKVVQNKVFKTVNGYPLGDVAQNIVKYKGFFFIAVNNSHKIEMLDTATFKSIKTIDLPNSSPRYIQVLDDSILLVTELYANKIWVVNYMQGILINSIATTGWTENIAFIQNKIVVIQKTKPGGSLEKSILIIDKTTLAITKKIWLSSEPTDLALFNDFQFLVSTAGDSLHQIKPAIYFIDMLFETLKDSTFSTSYIPISKIVMNTFTREAFYLQKDIYKYNFTDSLPTVPFVTNTVQVFYGLGTDFKTGDVYASDALDFVQSSNIYRYNRQGVLLANFKAGVNTNQFLFY